MDLPWTHFFRFFSRWKSEFYLESSTKKFHKKHAEISRSFHESCYEKGWEQSIWDTMTARHSYDPYDWKKAGHTPTEWKKTGDWLGRESLPESDAQYHHFGELFGSLEENTFRPSNYSWVNEKREGPGDGSPLFGGLGFGNPSQNLDMLNPAYSCRDIFAGEWNMFKFTHHSHRSGEGRFYPEIHGACLENLSISSWHCWGYKFVFSDSIAGLESWLGLHV